MHPKKMKPMLQTKSKSKRNEKLGKFLTRSANIVSPDLSNLRKPIDTSVSDLYQVNELLENGTDEVKSILSYECNIIYECRVCYSLFRSILNFVSHKREYCREKFNITLRRCVLNNYNVRPARESIVCMYKTEQTSCNGIKNDRILRSQVSKEPNKKDLTAIIEMLNKKQEEYMEKQLKDKSAITDVPDDRHIYLEAIDTNCSAVYQTIESSDMVVDTIDLMKEQITELQNITEQNAFTIEEETSENQLEKSDSPIQANMSDEENKSLIYRLPMNNLSCSICNAKFSTKKTLTVHIKTLHTSKRLCYPCPFCTNIFANTWSVYRHLYKVHKKTSEQVRKLRPQIQEKAFHRKTIATSGRKNVGATQVSALKNVVENSDETQESINNIESDTKLCARRERRSNRKASLPTYLQYCQTPIAACDDTTIRIKRCKTLLASTSDDLMCETEDVNLVANTLESPINENASGKNFERTSSEICDLETTCILQNVASFNKDGWDMLGDQYNRFSECNSLDNNNDSDIISSENTNDNKLLSPAENQDNFVPDENLKPPGIMCIDTNKVGSAASKMRNRKREASSHHNKKRSIDSKERDNIDMEENNFKLRSRSTRSNKKKPTLLMMKSKIATVADFRKLRCLLCKRKFTSVPNLRRHVAIHLGWNRYRCKLCDFKCFVKSDCVAHCNKIHNMPNNRTAIAEIVLEIPEDEYMYDENVIANVTDSKAKSDNPGITVNVTGSSYQLEMESVNSNDSKMHVISQSDATDTNERVAESRENPECKNIDVNDGDKTKEMQDMSECIMKCRKLNDDPQLKRMVMEVIFGSTDTSVIETQTDTGKPILETSNGIEASGPVDANDNVNNAATIQKSKQQDFCPILNNVKHQRPMRNRIKPLNNDFIYDLKEVAYRKESALINNSETLHMRKKAKLYN